MAAEAARRPRFVSALKAAGEAAPGTWVFACRERRLAVVPEGETVRLPQLAEVEPWLPERRLYLGTLEGVDVLAAELPSDAALPADWKLRDLRGLGVQGAFDEVVFQLAGRAVQLVDWDRDHRFCGRCGTPTEDHPGERSKRCPSCRLTSYPRLAPAVIVTVEKEGEILLARSPHFPPGMYSALAGFVEPGESLEEAVEREVAEEVGVRVGEIRYFGSQPWPFPHSLMIAFTTRYVAGEIRLEDPEIEDAGWFAAGELPAIPPRLSIARALIDDFLARNRQSSGQ